MHPNIKSEKSNKKLSILLTEKKSSEAEGNGRRQRAKACDVGGLTWQRGPAEACVGGPPTQKGNKSPEKERKAKKRPDTTGETDTGGETETDTNRDRVRHEQRQRQ